MTRSLDEQLNRIERVQVSLATNQITERISDRFSRPQPPPSFEIQLGNLPPAVLSVAESLALRDMEPVLQQGLLEFQKLLLLNKSWQSKTCKLSSITGKRNVLAIPIALDIIS